LQFENWETGKPKNSDIEVNTLVRARTLAADVPHLNRTLATPALSRSTVSEK
jgi:hypothetical protein